MNNISVLGKFRFWFVNVALELKLTFLSVKNENQHIAQLLLCSVNIVFK